MNLFEALDRFEISDRYLLESRYPNIGKDILFTVSYNSNEVFLIWIIDILKSRMRLFNNKNISFGSTVDLYSSFGERL